MNKQTQAPTITISTTTPGTFTNYVIQADNNGCTSPLDSIVAIVTKLPSVPTLTNIVRCQGDTLTLPMPDKGDTLKWYIAAMGNQLGNPPSTTVSAGVTTYYVAQKDSNKCVSGTDNITVTIKPVPVFTATSSADSVCSGMPVTLTASSANTALSYSWTGGITNGQAFNPASSQSYTVTVTDTNKCVMDSSLSVKVNQLPPVSITGLKKEYCVNDPTDTLRFSPPKGSFNNLGLLSFSGGDTSFIPSNIKTSSDTTITIIYSYANPVTQCSTAVADTVTVYSIPVVTFTNPIFCYSDDSTYILSDTLYAHAYPVGGSFSYPNNNGSFIPSAIGVDTTLYITCTYTAPGGCSNNAVIDTIKVDKPTVYFRPATGFNTSYCQNAPADTILVNPYQSKAFSSSFPVFTDLGNGKLVMQPSLADTLVNNSFSYIYTDNNGCKDTLKGNVVINPYPAQPTASAPQDSVCSGHTLSLTASTQSNVSYSWTGPTSYISSDQNSQINSIDSTMTGYYVVKTKNGFNCYSFGDSVFVFVKPSPPVPQLYIPSVTACIGYIQVLSDTSSYTSYTWENNGIAVNGVNAPLLYISNGGSYKLMVTHAENDCIAESDTLLAESTDLVPIIKGLGAPIDTVLQCASAQDSIASYQWYVDNKLILGSNNQSLNIYYNGSYLVLVNYKDGCGQFSIPYEVNRLDLTSISRITAQTDSTIIISPPTSDIQINYTDENQYTVSYSPSTDESLFITVTSLTGEVLWKKEISAQKFIKNETLVTMDNYVPGMYIIGACSASQQKNQKVVVD